MSGDLKKEARQIKSVRTSLCFFLQISKNRLGLLHTVHMIFRLDVYFAFLGNGSNILLADSALTEFTEFEVSV